MKKSELREEIISEIQKIYKAHSAGGALHKIENAEMRELFVKCACNLLEIGGERARDNVIGMAFDRMRGDNSEQG